MSNREQEERDFLYHYIVKDGKVIKMPFHMYPWQQNALNEGCIFPNTPEGFADAHSKLIELTIKELYAERTAKIEEAVALECVRQGKSPDQLAREGWSVFLDLNGNFIKFDNH